MIGIGSTLTGRRRTQISPGKERSTELAATAAPHHPSTAHLPTHEQIAQRAFEVYASSGYAQGHCEQNWLQAERELIEETLDAEV